MGLGKDRGSSSSHVLDLPREDTPLLSNSNHSSSNFKTCANLILEQWEFVMVEDVMIFLQSKPIVQAFGSVSVFFYGLGVSVYAFEGIGMVLPLEAKAKDKQRFGKILGISIFQ
ncbi:hypothetical protein Leryth_008177 [Lithospermum erythrorhizon]|nr:hypothetical protein Leryth_008177 [Lithospermum erythrorhizon]